MNLPRLEVEVNIVEAGSRRQPGHRRHRPHEREEEPGTHARPHVPDRDGESRGRALHGRVRREGEVRLGHADREVVEALLLVPLDLLLGLGEELHAARPVDLLGDRLDLGLNRGVEVVEELEV